MNLSESTKKGLLIMLAMEPRETGCKWFACKMGYGGGKMRGSTGAAVMMGYVKRGLAIRYYRPATVPGCDPMITYGLSAKGREIARALLEDSNATQAVAAHGTLDACAKRESVAQDDQQSARQGSQGETVGEQDNEPSAPSHTGDPS